MAIGLSWPQLLQSLYEFYDKASESLDWLAWSQEATGNISIGQAPPPSPQSPAQFQDALDRARTRIQELQIPTFDAPLPDSGTVPTNGFDATRQAIRSRISTLLNCVSEVSDARASIEYFSTLEGVFENQISMLSTLSQVMFDLAEKYPIKMLAETLVFRALDVDNSYIPFVADTLEELRAKRKAAITALDARLSEVRGAANEIKNLLAVEAIDLKVSLDHLLQLDADVARLQEEFLKAFNARNEAAADVQRQKVLRDAAELDVAETQERITIARMRVSQIWSNIDQVNDQIKIPYLCPVSKVDWANCNNAAHAEYKNQYQENQGHLRKELNRLRESLEDAKAVVATAMKDLSSAQATLESYERKFSKAKEILQAADSRQLEVRKELENKARFRMEEKHRLRADIFWSENQFDQSDVQAIITQLGASP
jgi:hypothetical protein